MVRLGKLNDGAIERGLALGVNFSGGTLNKKDGRVRLFSRKFPGTSKSGYCLRSRVVWWVYTGEALSGCEFNIHHINGDRTDDRIENLEKLTHIEHAHEHNGYRWENVLWAMCKCKKCGKEFKIQSAKLKDFSSGKRGSFCSQKCYHEFPKEPRKLEEQKHCHRGHEYTQENIYWVKSAHSMRKSCKICRKQNNERYRKCAVG